MRSLKLIGWSLLILLLILIGFFAYGCYGGRYNERALNELEGRIIYTKRDTDSVLKIYTAKANLEDEILLYEHHDSIDNGNIIALEYDEEQACLIFEAYDDTIGDFGLFTLDAELNVTSLGVSSMKGTWESDKNSGYNDSGLGVISKDGDLYLHQQTPHQMTLIKDYKGMLDYKFSPGYIPLTVSTDGKFVFYRYSNHVTPIGVLLDGLMLQNFDFKTYVMNIETGESSLYVNFHDIIFIN